MIAHDPKDGWTATTNDTHWPNLPKERGTKLWDVAVCVLALALLAACVVFLPAVFTWMGLNSDM